MLSNLSLLRNLLVENGVFFTFNGYMSQNVLGGIGEAIEAKLLELNVNNNVSNNVFAIFTEQMQNVMSYSFDNISKSNNKYESLGISVMGFSREKNKYFVGSGNFIRIEDREKLLAKLNKINSLQKEDLKNYYKELRRNGKGLHNRGAGLGFLEMAKRASEPLDFKIIETESKELFFQLFVYI